MLTRLRFWEDDALVFSKETSKLWGPRPYLEISLMTASELHGTAPA